MRIRFGGPTFPERNSFVSSKSDPSVGRVKTWFYDLDRPDGRGGYVQQFAYYGEEFPVSQVQNWKDYVDRGMATIIEEKDDSAGAAGSNDSREEAAQDKQEAR